MVSNTDMYISLKFFPQSMILFVDTINYQQGLRCAFGQQFIEHISCIFQVNPNQYAVRVRNAMKCTFSKNSEIAPDFIR